jgi:hypothetical protein
MDENISMMNKYSELYWVSVRRLVCRAQTAECQVCSLDNIFFQKISYKRARYSNPITGLDRP